MPDQKPHIPRPPSKEALDQMSEEQGMIADEWAPAPTPPQPDPGKKDPP